MTLKAEDEIARERQESEQPAIIITDTPSVPKLTRAKARELNKTPGINLSSINDITKPEIATLIQEELNSDEDDGEYVFKEEDFIVCKIQLYCSKLYFSKIPTYFVILVR